MNILNEWTGWDSIYVSMFAVFYSVRIAIVCLFRCVSLRVTDQPTYKNTCSKGIYFTLREGIAFRGEKLTKGLILNVGASKSKKAEGFHSPIFSDGSFKFLPILSEEGINPPTTYRSLGLAEYVPERVRDCEVHNDPEWATFTYGHVKRFNEMGEMRSLRAGDFLFFMAALVYKGEPKLRKPWINPDWGMYIISFFRLKETLTADEIARNREKVEKDYAMNAHILRGDIARGKPHLLFKGDDTSKLLGIAVPLSSSEKPLLLTETCMKLLTTIKGRPLTKEDRLWYRWTLMSENQKLQGLLQYLDGFQR